METKFNFKSQVCTDKVQSERLLALGLKKETADMCHRTNGMGIYFITTIDPLCNPNDIPAWSLGRLIEMLPGFIQPKEELPSFSDCAYLNLTQIAVWYDYTDYDMDNRTLISWGGNGIFLAVVDAIEWLINEELFNKEYLV